MPSIYANDVGDFYTGMVQIRFSEIALVILLELVKCHIVGAAHLQYRPQKADCHPFLYYNASFAISNPSTRARVRYCTPETGFVPNTYVHPRTEVHSSTTYSLWASFDDRVGMGTPQETSVCQQQPIGNLCRGVHEIPLFVVGVSNSEFECRCDEGFFKSASDNSAPCTRCPDNAFCPIFTNHHFRCPGNTKLALPETSAGLRGIQRLLSLHAGSSFCAADPGYRLQHAHVDINALILAGRSSPSRMQLSPYSVTICSRVRSTNTVMPLLTSSHGVSMM